MASKDFRAVVRHADGTRGVVIKAFGNWPEGLEGDAAKKHAMDLLNGTNGKKRLAPPDETVESIEEVGTDEPTPAPRPGMFPEGVSIDRG